IYNTFYVNNLKPYTPNNDKEFPGLKLEKPSPVEDDRWEVKKVLEFRLAPRTGERQYKVRWLGYSLAHDQWVSASHISLEILQEFWVKGSLQDTFKRRQTKNGKSGPRIRDQTRALIQQERDLVMQTQITSASSIIESASIA